MAIPYSRTIVGGLPWYSVLIVVGIALAVYLAGKEERRLGLPKDTSIDLALVVVPCGIVGARIYYVAMSWQSFAGDPLSVLYIWEGGIAIYGAVIGGAVGAWIYARIKKLSFARIADMIAPGLLLAQAIGRWGNYFNMEAYGPAVQNAGLQFFPLAVLVPSGDGYAWHAATFFYESVWNLCGFGLLWKLRAAQRRNGAVFAWYLLIYGSGRFVIEQLRQDSLYLGPLRVSQYLSVILCAAAGMWLLRGRYGKNRTAFAGALLCLSLWLMRWACLQLPGWYAALMMISGVTAVWLTRQKPAALAWTALGIGMDGAGLAMAIAGWPVSAGFALQIHALLCSAALLPYLWALMLRSE